MPQRVGRLPRCGSASGSGAGDGSRFPNVRGGRVLVICHELSVVLGSSGSSVSSGGATVTVTVTGGLADELVFAVTVTLDKG